MPAVQELTSVYLACIIHDHLFTTETRRHGELDGRNATRPHGRAGACAPCLSLRVSVVNNPG